MDARVRTTRHITFEWIEFKTWLCPPTYRVLTLLSIAYRDSSVPHNFSLIKGFQGTHFAVYNPELSDKFTRGVRKICRCVPPAVN